MIKIFIIKLASLTIILIRKCEPNYYDNYAKYTILWIFISHISTRFEILNVLYIIFIISKNILYFVSSLRCALIGTCIGVWASSGALVFVTCWTKTWTSWTPWNPAEVKLWPSEFVEEDWGRIHSGKSYLFRHSIFSYLGSIKRLDFFKLFNVIHTVEVSVDFTLL